MKRPKVTGLRRRESWQALPFLLPSLLGLCLFYLFPLAETVRASFMDPLRSRAVGWGNYRALFQNTAFRLAVRNTCRFLCICIPALLPVKSFLPPLSRAATFVPLFRGYMPLSFTSNLNFLKIQIGRRSAALSMYLMRTDA